MLNDGVDISSVVTEKPGLNGKFWEKGGHLKNNVRLRMIELGNEFYKFLKLPYKLKDIYFVGGNAGYSWTSQSDLDIHCIFDAEEEDELLTNYIFAKKQIWNTTHKITIKSFPVEMFAKNTEEELDYKAIYSLTQDKWIKKPKKNDKKIDTEVIQQKVDELVDSINSIDTIEDTKKKYEIAQQIKDKIQTMRKAGLEKGGEFSNENLAFKVLRNTGFIDKLNKINVSNFDKTYSLDEKNDIDVPKIPDIINESMSPSHKFEYGCLMLYMKFNGWNKILEQIQEEDVYNEPGFGLEAEPHTTLLYGFHDNNVKVENIIEVAEKFIKKQIETEATGISIFPGNKDKPYDVVKFDIKSDVLHKTNAALKKFPNTNTFPEYHPHVTIAYVKVGEGKKYEQVFEEPIKILCTELVYSHPDKTKEAFKLPKVNILKVEKNIEGMTSEKVEMIKKFMNFAANKLELEEPVTVVLHNNRLPGMTTAFFKPATRENHIKAGGRACADLCRSIFHEMVHLKQLSLGIYNLDSEVQNISGAIEDAANSLAGAALKDFAINYDNDDIYNL